MSAWAARYEKLALTGVRLREVTERIARQLLCFAEYLSATYGQEQLASPVRRNVVGCATRSFRRGWAVRVGS